MLAKLGVRARVAGNGEEALVLLQTEDFDLVLMDCQMPVLDGYQATAAIRKREVNQPRRLPIVAFLDEAGDAVTQIKEAIVANDTEKLRLAAHSLKSSSANVGAQGLSAIFRELELCGREGRMADARSLLETMHKEYGRARTELQEQVRAA